MNGLIVVTLIIVVCGVAWVWLRNKNMAAGGKDVRGHRRTSYHTPERGDKSRKRKPEKEEPEAAASDGKLSRFKAQEKSAAGKVKHRHSTVRRIPFYPLLAIVVAVTAGIVIVLLLLNSFFTSPEAPPASDTSGADILTMYSTAGEILADYVSEHYSERGKILVLMPPARLTTEGDEKVLAKMTEQMDEDIALDVHKLDDTSNDEAEAEAEEKLWFNADVFDRAISERGNYTAVVSIAGLPARPEKIDFWHRDRHPDLILINAPLYRLGRLIREGYIRAVIVRRPEISLDTYSVAASDKKKWLLVTADTLPEIKERYKGLLLEDK